MGWDIVSKNQVETTQQVIKKLATNEGLAMIKVLVEEKVDSSGLETNVRFFKERTLPFLRTISYLDVLSSLVLEAPLDTILTFLFGPNGRRATRLFRFTASALGAFAWDETIEDEDLPSIGVTATLVVLEKIVELNQTAQVIPEFPSIVSDLEICIPERYLQAGSRSMNRIRKRLGLGAAMPVAGDRPAEPKAQRPVFEISQDLPGELSELGPRHDNDHENIDEIKILPTTDEIQASRLEYLPSNDPAKHHLPGLAGLLDRQFRLIREDTVGQLRDAVQIEYERLKKSSSAQSAPPWLQSGIRTIVYQEVMLLRRQFDRNKGLQLVVEFNQPPPLAKKTAKEREEWWKTSRQLQTDAFVCLVSSKGRFVFFSVCDPTPSPPLRRKNEGVGDVDEAQLEEDRRALAELPNLFGHATRATVMLTQVEDNPEDITWINTQLGVTAKLQLSLVEFPGVLLASFRPTLQALQQMSRALDLPLSQFIAPDTQHAETIDIPAPAYSRRPGFAFDLQTLVGGVELRLVPGQPFDYAKLREKSTLDDAQQLSTIKALRSSLALIQGPPGTGKSYTGVAIIKALLQNRRKANLGPLSVSATQIMRWINYLSILSRTA